MALFTRRQRYRKVSIRVDWNYEGTGAGALAAALSPRCGGSHVVAIISGGDELHQ